MASSRQPGDIVISTSSSAFPIFICAGVLFFFIVLSFLASDSPDVSGSTQTGTRLPSASGLIVPARPFYAGYEARLRLHKGQDSERELVFSYERLTIIAVTSLSDIPISIQKEAIGFGPNGKSTRRFPPEEASLSRLGLLSDGSLVYPTDKQKPYIVHGSVDISCGPLNDYDVGVADVSIEDDNARGLLLDLQHFGRGPPLQSAGDLTRDGHRLSRVVYIIGHINSFTGPDQQHKSLMRTSVIDLGQTRGQQRRYQRRMQAFDSKIHDLAVRYHLRESDLSGYENRAIDIADGKIISNPPGFSNRFGSGFRDRLSRSEVRDNPLERPHVEAPHIAVP